MTDPEQKEANSLSEQEERLIGEYTNILVKHGVATATDFLETLPERPSARVQDLLQTARLLHLAASARRPTPVTE